jgi:hypothetical protein
VPVQERLSIDAQINAAVLEHEMLALDLEIKRYELSLL